MSVALDFKRPFRWAGLAFLLIGVLLGVLFVVLGLVASHTEGGMARTTGTVVDVRTQTGRDEDGHTTTTRRVVIAYEVDGTTYRTIESSLRNIGDTVTVVYDPDHSEEGRPAGGNLVFWVLAASLGVPFTIIGLIIVLWASAGTDWSRVPRATSGGDTWRWGQNPLAADEPIHPASSPDADGYLAYPTDDPTPRAPDDGNRDLR